MYLKKNRRLSGTVLALSYERSVFLERDIHFEETLGDQVLGRSPKKLKSLLDVPYIVHVKVHVLSFNVILISSP